MDEKEPIDGELDEGADWELAQKFLSKCLHYGDLDPYRDYRAWGLMKRLMAGERTRELYEKIKEH